jgi:phosphoglycolate phosphatase
MQSPTLVLDLDGTLVDTAPDLMRALNVVLESEGMAPVALGASIAMVGLGARAMIESAFAAAGKVPGEAKLTELMARFIQHYSTHIADHSRPFPGAEAALGRFSNAGWRLAICTNKLEGLARQLLQALGLAKRFSAITGQDTFGFRKPDPRHLVETIRAAGGEPGNAVMVGDSRTDIDCARAAGIPVVAVNFGYTAVPVEELGPDRVIGRFEALWDAVASLQPFSLTPIPPAP